MNKTMEIVQNGTLTCSEMLLESKVSISTMWWHSGKTWSLKHWSQLSPILWLIKRKARRQIVWIALRFMDSISWSMTIKNLGSSKSMYCHHWVVLHPSISGSKPCLCAMPSHASAWEVMIRADIMSQAITYSWNLSKPPWITKRCARRANLPAKKDYPRTSRKCWWT